jgi:hypothetical protein
VLKRIAAGFRGFAFAADNACHINGPSRIRLPTLNHIRFIRFNFCGGSRQAFVDSHLLRIMQLVTIVFGAVLACPHRRPLQNQAANLESHPIHPIQLLSGRTLSRHSPDNWECAKRVSWISCRDISHSFYADISESPAC